VPHKPPPAERAPGNCDEPLRDRALGCMGEGPPAEAAAAPRIITDQEPERAPQAPVVRSRDGDIRFVEFFAGPNIGQDG
jgi:hypothetical protein